MSLNDNDTSRAKVWFRVVMQAAVGNRSVAEGARLSTEHPKSRRNTQGTARDFLLNQGEITGDVVFKDHNDENHFLAYEVRSRVAAHTYLDRKN